MILAADSSATDLIRGIATECGVDFDEDPEAMVIDHINYAVTDVDGDHTLIAGDDLIQSDVILGSKKIEVSLDAKFYFQTLGLDMLTGLNNS